MGACLLLVTQVQGAETLDENELKAVLVYKLTKFVTWPAEEPPAGGEEKYLYVCALQKDPFGGALAALERRHVGDRQVVIREVERADLATTACHMLYVPASGMRDLAGVQQALGERPVLTVGDVEGFANAGGMVEFHREQRRFTFFINIGATRRAGLAVAASLLELSTVIDGEAAR